MTADRTQGTGVVSRAAVARLEGAKAEIIRPMAGATVAAARVVGSHRRSMRVAGQQQAEGSELRRTGRGQAAVRVETTIRVYMIPSEAIDRVVRRHRKGARASARVGQNQQGRRGSNSATAQQTSVILPNRPPDASHDPLVEVHAIRKVDGVGGRVVGVGVVGVGVVGDGVVGDRVEIDGVGMNESRQLWHVGLAVGQWSPTCKAEGIQG